MRSGLAVMFAPPKGRRSFRRFLLRAVPLSILVGAGVLYLTERYRVGIDGQENPCLPDARVSLIDTADHDVSRGELVAFIAHGLEPLIADGTVMVKMVMGVPGDVVEIGLDVVRVNGEVVGEGLDLAGTLGRPADSFVGSFIVLPGFVFPMGLTRDSYDGRYFGPVPRLAFVGQAWGLW